MDDAKLRAWWAHRQGLTEKGMKGSAADILAKTGWARSVGGAGPYLTLHARAGIGRKAADASLASVEIHELPSARGCTYVVPAADYGLALTVGQGFGTDAQMNVARKLGVTDAEIDKLKSAIVKALAEGPLTPEELRAATGGAARSLGDAGKKKGLTTTMPVALGQLQSEGEIRRIPVDGRIDQQRYRYAAWRPNPLESYRPSRDEAYTELARRFFGWIGPATLAEFRWFSGLGVKAAKAAAEPLGLVAMEAGDERMLLPRDREELRAFAVPKKSHYVLVSSLDGLTHLRRDVKGLLADADRKRRVFVEKGRELLGLLGDLPSHGIFDRGRLVGLWEYDVDSKSIAWMSFVPRDKTLEAAVARTEEFVRADLEDARSFSLDSPRSRVPRIEALRKDKKS